LHRLEPTAADAGPVPLPEEEPVAPVGSEVDNLIRCFTTHLTNSLGDRLVQWVKRVLVPWLEVHRYAGRTSYDYPRAGDGTIFGYHSDLRGKHAEGRKKTKSAAPLMRYGLRELGQFQ